METLEQAVEQLNCGDLRYSCDVTNISYDDPIDGIQYA